MYLLQAKNFRNLSVTQHKVSRVLAAGSVFTATRRRKPFSMQVQIPNYLTTLILDQKQINFISLALRLSPMESRNHQKIYWCRCPILMYFCFKSRSSSTFTNSFHEPPCFVNNKLADAFNLIELRFLKFV